MVIQKAIMDLKGKPQEDRKAVAGGIALGVVAVLIVAWAFFFFQNMRSGQFQDFESTIPDEFNFSSVQEAQKELMEGFSGLDELRAVREQLGGNGENAAVQEEYEASETDQFGQPSGSF
jgi:hypothetical protein